MRPRTNSGHLDGIWAGGPHARQGGDRLFLLAREEGVSVRDAAAFAGFGARTAEKRGAVKLPRSYTGRPWGSGSGRIANRQKRTGETRAPKRNRSSVRAACVRPPSGDDPHQIHSLLLKAVLYDLKKTRALFRRRRGKDANSEGDCSWRSACRYQRLSVSPRYSAAPGTTTCLANSF